MINKLQSVGNRAYVLLMVVFMMVLLASNALMESLNISGLLDIDSIFGYANILLAALVPVVLIGLGFALASYIIKFVQRVFNNLG